MTDVKIIVMHYVDGLIEAFVETVDKNIKLKLPDTGLIKIKGHTYVFHSRPIMQSILFHTGDNGRCDFKEDHEIDFNAVSVDVEVSCSDLKYVNDPITHRYIGEQPIVERYRGKVYVHKRTHGNLLIKGFTKDFNDIWILNPKVVVMELLNDRGILIDLKHKYKKDISLFVSFNELGSLHYMRAPEIIENYVYKLTADRYGGLYYSGWNPIRFLMCQRVDEDVYKISLDIRSVDVDTIIVFYDNKRCTINKSIIKTIIKNRFKNIANQLIDIIFLEE